jgi:hypothetical protein
MLKAPNPIGRSGFAAILAALSGLVLMIGCASLEARDEDLSQCAVVGKVAAKFELAQSRDFSRLIPNAGDAPELERDDPAVFFVFHDPAEIPQFGRGGRSGPYTGVVCVVVSGSTSGLVYYGVDTSQRPSTTGDES